MRCDVGIDAALEDEIGERLAFVEDPKNLLATALATSPHAGTICLRFIDPYQTTMFNQRQMTPLIAELEALAQTVVRDEKLIVEDVIGLARKCAAEPHLYLKFFGD
jgi:hypothetical protein